ncbi:taste receptor type 2 member 4-like [Gastrophryne carolinensis]
MRLYPHMVQLLFGIGSGLLGIVLNSWIIFVNVEDWRKGGRMSPCDHILSLMGIVNTLLQGLFSTGMILTEMGAGKTSVQANMIIIKIINILIGCNLWLTAWLSIYYCLKIVPFSKGSLLFLKMRISSLVLKLLAITMIDSIGLAVLSHWSFHAEAIAATITNVTNVTCYSFKKSCRLVVSPVYLIVVLVECFLALILTLVPIAVTLISLWRHVRMIKRKDVNSSRFQTQAHILAAKTMLLLLTIHVVFYGACVASVLKSFRVDDITMYVSSYFLLVYPITQAVVIITRNSKLSTAWRRLMRQAMLGSLNKETSQVPPRRP